MSVVAFPMPEPWPAEFFDEFGLNDLVQLRDDLDAVIAEREQMRPDFTSARRTTA